MIKIKVTNKFSNWPLIKQTPQRSGIWGDCHFFINQDIEECDYWVVLEGLEKKESTRCPKENTILITWEPPSIKKYDKKFTDQFATIISCHTDIDHPNVIHNQQALPWMVGGKYLKNSKTWDSDFSKDYNELSRLNKSKKTKILSVISSLKDYTAGHRQRLEFIEKLKKAFNNEIDIFGRGFNGIPDKWDAIAPYKYHIAIENSKCNDYWTEKLSDTFLSLSYPIYHGCPNIDKYFSTDSLLMINIRDAEEAIKKIRFALENKLYEKNISALKNAKELILNKYNVFPMITGIISKLEIQHTEKPTIAIQPEEIISKKKFLNKIILKHLKI